MSDLANLAVSRASLPVFAPGQPLPEQLRAGRDAAAAVLAKYVPNLSFDQAQADAVMAKIQVWEERNRDALAAALADPSSTELSEQIRVVFGSSGLQQFILATFTQAAVGLGPWFSGRVATEADRGEIISASWAREDAERRLQVFGSIVRMEQQGFLKTVFVPPTGTSGLGTPAIPAGLIWAIVIIAIAVTSAVLLFTYASFRLLANNKLMRDMCLRAQNEHDTKTVEQCLDATKGLQAEGMFPGMGDFVKAVGVIVGVGLVGMLAMEVVPALITARRRRRA